jgi:hypothetical protein
MTRVLVKIARNICSLSQVKFLVVVNLSVSKPLHKPFPRALEKDSGERSLILRLKRIDYNTTKISVLPPSPCLKMFCNKH